MLRSEPPWIRSAFWTGAIKPGCEQRFQTLIDEVIVPGLRALPGVHSAIALWPRLREDAPPAIACQVLVRFAAQADAQRMLASAERQALRPRVLEAAALFDGSISHIEFETPSSIATGTTP